MASAADAAVITSIGMVTPGGYSAHAACAAIQAGITRFTELETISLPDDDGAMQPVVGSSIRGVTDGTRGLGRVTRMAADALRDLIDNADLPEGGLATAGFYLGLPPPDRPPLTARLADAMGARLERWCKLRGAALRTRVFPSGHASFIEALAAALADLERGSVTAAVVGGVDSLVEPETVGILHQQGRLKTNDTKVGIIPGEGAAFTLIEPSARARARGATCLATVEAPSTATEQVLVTSRDPCDGKGLGAAIGKTLSQLDDQGVETGLILSDLNGEPYRSEELGYAMVRALHNVKAHLDVFHAADCIGDTGAAAAAIAACAGARALHRGYARTSNALLTASSDGGLRGVAYLRARRAEPATSKERGR